MRISSPPTQWPCYYGIDTPTRGELIASSHSVDEINQYITSDTLAYLSLDGMKQAVVAARTGAAGRSTGSHGRSLPVVGQPLDTDSFCLACWTGEYPIAFVPHPRQRQMRLLDC
jgi:amidophosphoribosyltransferase